MPVDVLQVCSALDAADFPTIRDAFEVTRSGRHPSGADDKHSY